MKEGEIMTKDHNNILSEKYKTYCDELGIPFYFDEEQIRKACDYFELQYNLGKIDIHKICKIYDCYEECIKGIRIQQAKEKIQNGRLAKEKQAREQLERCKGPLWVGIENLKNNPTSVPTESILSTVKSSILPVLDQSYHENYLNFLEWFQQLWNELYDEYCFWEKNELSRGIFCEKTAFSVGIDELTNKVSRCCSCYGNYQPLFQYEKVLTNLIPDNSRYYFLEAHLDIVTKNLLIDYEKNNFADRIYTFLTSSRIIKLKEQYYQERFKLEEKQGITGTVYIKNGEIYDYIENHLKPYYNDKILLKKL